MASQLERIITSFYEDLARSEDKALSALQSAYTQSLTAFDREAERVLARIEASGLTESRAFQLQRLEMLASQAADEAARYGDLVAGEILDVQRTGFLVAQSSSVETIGAVSPLDPMASYAKLPNAAIERLTGSLANGSPLQSLTNSFGRAVGNGMQTLLFESVALGRSPLETARLMRNILGIPHSRAKTIVRTEQLRIFRETNRQTFLRNSGVVRKWKWYATLDRFTCPVCWAMHGKEFELTQSMETHPNCRCVQIPVTATYKQLGINNLNEPVRDRTLLVPGDTLFDEQSESTKRFILGPKGYQAYQLGLVRLDDFVQPTYSAEWGRGRTTKPLSAILPTWRQLLP